MNLYNHIIIFEERIKANCFVEYLIKGLAHIKQVFLKIKIVLAVESLDSDINLVQL